MKKQQQQKDKKVVSAPAYNEDVDPVKQGFEIFDENDDKINAAEISQSMQSIGFDRNTPAVYQVISDLDAPEYSKKGGASFKDFAEAVNNKFSGKDTVEGLRKVFDLFAETPGGDTMTADSLVRLCQQIGDETPEDTLRTEFEVVSKRKGVITFDEFCAIMNPTQ